MRKQFLGLLDGYNINAVNNIEANHTAKSM